MGNLSWGARVGGTEGRRWQDGRQRHYFGLSCTDLCLRLSRNIGRVFTVRTFITGDIGQYRLCTLVLKIPLDGFWSKQLKVHLFLD